MTTNEYLDYIAHERAERQTERVWPHFCNEG